MPEELTEEQKRKYESYLTVHLKKGERDLPTGEKITALKKRDRNKWIHLLINIAAILVFGYSFYFDITQLSETFFIIIIIVFVVNIILIFYQKYQIRKLIEFLSRERHE